MKELLGKCNLGFRAATGEYILLKYRSGVMVEPIVSISCSEMKSNGLSIVLDILRNPSGPDAKEMSNFDEKTKKNKHDAKGIQQDASFWFRFGSHFQPITSFGNHAGI